MNLRLLLIIFAVIFVFIIIIDSYRRIKRARNNDLLLDFYDLNGELNLDSELPSGGARVKKQEPFLDFESVGRQEARDESQDQFAGVESMPGNTAEDPIEEEPSPTRCCDLQQHNARSLPPIPQASSDTLFLDAGLHLASSTAQTNQHQLRESSDKPKLNIQVKELVVINLVRGAHKTYQGEELVEGFMRYDLQFGDMGIFHYALPSDTSKIIFSVANGVEPGTFDLDQLSQLQTPALSFFMGLPNFLGSLQAFDTMLRVIRHLSEELGGQMRDEQGSFMLQQTLEHYRNRIIEFDRKQLVDHGLQ